MKVEPQVLETELLRIGVRDEWQRAFARRARIYHRLLFVELRCAFPPQDGARIICKTMCSGLKGTGVASRIAEARPIFSAGANLSALAMRTEAR